MAKTHGPSSTTMTAKKKILIVGDWVVDEHWVIGVHRSPTSSRVGHQHFRALHNPNNALEAFCGAGQSASILYRTVDGSDYVFDTVGAGIWDAKDTEVLTGMLEATPNRGESPYRLSRNHMPPKNDAKLFNLGPLIDPKSDFHCGTTRVIRIYQHTGTKLELLQRIDWELPVPHAKESWFAPEREEVVRLAELVTGIDAIVIKDLSKGVISTPLIKWLRNLAPQAQWFISTKAWRPIHEPAVTQEQPAWLHDLAGADLRLLVIPHVAAARAVRETDLNRWITRSGVPSRRALSQIDGLSSRFPMASIIVLPDGLSVLALDKLSHNAKVCLVQTETESHSLDSDKDAAGIGVPMASVFFSAAIAPMIYTRPANLEQVLKPALAFTHTWMKKEVDRIKRSEDQNLEEQLQLDFAALPVPIGFERWQSHSWSEISGQWSQAFSECGIIDIGGHPRIELWRAMSEVDGYVCCVPSKRSTIQRLLRHLASFKTNPHQHRSYMLVASPGSGKTHFVRQLAKSLDLHPLQFNITQMLSKRDILDCFDTIVTTQAQNRDKHLLVFIDEINASLGSQQVYDAFLAPMGEGIYVRGGKTFQIPPCVWLFAGTENPLKQRNKSMKGSDFVSRLSIPPVLFRTKDGEEDDLNTERVYLGVSLLKSVFSDVRHITEKVLLAFSLLKSEVEIRRIRNFVESFSGIQHGKVTEKNVPIELFSSLTTHVPKWSEHPEGRLVEIVG